MDETKEVVAFDPSRVLTYAALAFVGFLIVFIGSIIVAQIIKDGKASTEAWAALTGALGWATGVASILYNNKFGSTAQSLVKDNTIATQARTAAVIASAVPATTTTTTKTTTGAAPPVDTPPPTNEDK